MRAHIMRIALPIISRASPMLLLYRSLDCATERRDEPHDVRRRQRVEVFMANDFKPLADHRVKRLRRAHEFDGEFHRLALKATPDRLLHR